ncbi:MAG: gamma-glutamyltransferase [Micropruina glycogenica]
MRRRPASPGCRGRSWWHRRPRRPAVPDRGGDVPLSGIHSEQPVRHRRRGSCARHQAGRPPARAGESTSNPLLAGVLDQLADEGPELFTTGAVAQALASDMQQRDGLITAADLAQYRPVTRPAHVSTVGRWRIGVNPPPAVGGRCWR